MRRALLLFGPVLLAGLALTIGVLRERDRDPSFGLAQERVSALTSEAVEGAVGSAPEPRADDRGRPATSTRCRPGPEGTETRSPWRCVARYPSGETIRYTVAIQPDGAFRGESPDGVRRVVGRIQLDG